MILCWAAFSHPGPQCGQACSGLYVGPFPVCPTPPAPQMQKDCVCYTCRFPWGSQGVVRATALAGLLSRPA